MSVWNAFCWNPVEMRSNWHVDEVKLPVISFKSDAEMSSEWGEASEISLLFKMLLDSGATRCQKSTVLQSGPKKKLGIAHIFGEILFIGLQGKSQQQYLSSAV